jgi:carbamoyl-phosphate synthase large subunit
MGDVIPIIITGGGCPGITGTIDALRNNPDDTQFRIITTDIEPDVVGKYFSDAFYQVPAPENYDNYTREIYRIAKDEKAKVILPLTTRETQTLSGCWFTESIVSLGCTIATSHYTSISKANDKYLLIEEASKIGIPCPEYILTNSYESFSAAIFKFGYPAQKVVVRPRVSSGMRGLRILNAEMWKPEKFYHEKPNGVETTPEYLIDMFHKSKAVWPTLLVTEYLPGTEYTVDVFRGVNGTVAIPRVRERMRSGITFDARIDLRKDLIDYSTLLSDLLNLKYCHGYQFKCDDDGVPKLLECNPRIQGTMAASTGAGFNMIYASVMEALGHPADIDAVQLKNGTLFKRYWGGIFINAK